MSFIISKTKYVFFVAVFLLGIPVVHAESGLSQSLSVTPPLFQLSALPGDIWQSSVKVVNGNSYPLTIYTEVVNFSPIGEAGQGTFASINDADSSNASLAEWIHIQEGSQEILPEGSKDIPFFVEIPKDAPPGGHYAAILVSTQPPKTQEGTSAVLTSQAVSSLFFVRIEGDVHENGTIREFRVIDSFVEKPNAEFSLRFENKGNVHLQPKGNITIRNMWGTERGVIPVNYQTHFGNVLPLSIRDFKFSWESDFNIADIGVYTAEVTLAYGVDEIKSTSATAYFWVVPIKATLITLGTIAIFVWLIVFMIRAYVRRMLALAGVPMNSPKRESIELAEPVKESKKQKKSMYQNVSAPLRDGVLDLRRRLDTIDESYDVIKTILSFIYSYKIFFISVCVLILIFVTGVLYISKATEERNNYKVIIDEGDNKTILEAEHIKK